MWIVKQFEKFWYVFLGWGSLKKTIGRNTLFIININYSVLPKVLLYSYHLIIHEQNRGHTLRKSYHCKKMQRKMDMCLYAFQMILKNRALSENVASLRQSVQNVLKVHFSFNCLQRRWILIRGMFGYKRLKKSNFKGELKTYY